MFYHQIYECSNQRWGWIQAIWAKISEHKITLSWKNPENLGGQVDGAFFFHNSLMYSQREARDINLHTRTRRLDKSLIRCCFFFFQDCWSRSCFWIIPATPAASSLEEVLETWEDCSTTRSCTGFLGSHKTWRSTNEMKYGSNIVLQTQNQQMHHTATTYCTWNPYNLSNKGDQSSSLS